MASGITNGGDQLLVYGALIGSRNYFVRITTNIDLPPDRIGYFYLYKLTNTGIKFLVKRGPIYRDGILGLVPRVALGPGDEWILWGTWDVTGLAWEALVF